MTARYPPTLATTATCLVVSQRDPRLQPSAAPAPDLASSPSPVLDSDDDRTGVASLAGALSTVRKRGEYQSVATVSIRYIVDDVDAAIEFYCSHLGFTEQMHPAPTFAMVTRGDLRLVLSAPGGGPGGGQAMPDGTLPEPGGGWNRFSIETGDLAQTVTELRAAGVRFRNDIVTGVGGNQVLIEDPSGNPVELFEPVRAEAQLAGPQATGDGDGTYQVRPIGWVESVLVDPADAPNQGDRGAPDAWLVFDPAIREGVRDLEIGSDILVLTWLHRARRDELATRPGDDPTRPELGVFSTRSPARPNPVGLHRVSIRAIEDGKVQVGPLEAIDGTPLIDIKPVIRAREG
jgi:tRNA-Thr(GGU) m(6)t(6)A37 methyltransferase TsaA